MQTLALRPPLNNPGKICTKCSAGKFTTKSNQYFCNGCPAGYSQYNFGKTECSRCQPEKTFPFCVGQPKPTSGACPSGEYTKTCQPLTTSCNGIRECIACPSGWSLTLSSMCEQCKVGRFNDETAQTSCKSCAAGKYNNRIAISDPVMLACIDCAPGHYSELESVPACKSCDVGTFNSQFGNIVCPDCSLGKYNNEVGRKKCRICDAGQYVNLTRATACQSCPKGRALSEGSTLAKYHDSESDCESCVPLEYGPDEGLSECVACPGGHPSKHGMVTCSDGKCDPGFYKVNSKCLICPDGQYQEVRGQISCVLCPSGWFGLSSLSCQPCRRGFFGSLAGATDQSQGCLPCSAGRYSDQDHLAGPDSSSIPPLVPCDSCVLGTFSSIVGASSAATCISCAAGKFSNTDSATEEITACQPCDPGRYNAVIGASNSSDCRLCPAGYSNKKAASGSCRKCLKGYRSVEGSRKCNRCAPGRLAPREGFAGEKCLKALPGTFVALGGASVVEILPGFRAANCSENENTPQAAGCTRMEMCAAGTFGIFASNGTIIYSAGVACKSCPRGWSSASGLTYCSECPAGKFTGASGLPACLTCPRGWFARDKNSTTCRNCPGGWMSPADSAVCSGCEAGTSSFDGEYCVDCPSGWIQPMEESSTCLNCPVGWSTKEQIGAQLCFGVDMDPSVVPPKVLALLPSLYELQDQQVWEDANTNIFDMDDKPLMIWLEFTEAQLSYKTFVEWSSQNNLADEVIAQQHEDYHSKLLEKPNLSLLPQQNRRLETSSSRDTYVVNFTLGTYPLWVKPLYLRTTFVLESGGTGRKTMINMATPVKSDCVDAQNFQWYLRTHPHDDTCQDPLDPLSSNKTLDTIRCIQCPDGGSCNNPSGSGMYLWDVAPRQGWWRVPWGAKRGDLRNDEEILIEAPMFFAKCPHEEACMGVTNTAYFNNSGWYDNYHQLDVARNWSCPAPHPASLCREGTEGPLCAVCSDGYTRSRGQCAKCSSVEARIGFTLGLLLPTLGLMGWIRRNLKRLNTPSRNSLRDMSRIVVVFVNFAQILSSGPHSINVPWPKNLIEFLELFEVLNIDFAAITGATCDKDVNFKVRFALMSVCPAIILLLAFMTYCNGKDKITEDLEALHKAHNRDILERELADCYLDLFQLVDTDNSGAVDPTELVDLLKLVGFKSNNINEKYTLSLIQTMTGSVHVTELSMGVFLHEIKSGNMYELVERHVKRDRNQVKVQPEQPNKTVNLLHDNETDALLVWNRTRNLVSYSFSWAMQLLLLLHTPVSRKVFQYFDCRSVGTVGVYVKSFLRVDYSVQCYDGTTQMESYRSFMPLVVLVFGGFTVLLPVTLSLILLKNRRELYAPHMLLRLGWLYERLNHGTEFWEIHELLRKMLLTGFIVFFPSNAAVRSCMAMLICIAAQCSLSYNKPHRNPLVFWTDQASFSLCLIFYVCTVAFQANMPVEHNDQVGIFFIVMVILFIAWFFVAFMISTKSFCKQLKKKDHLNLSERVEKEHSAHVRAKQFNILEAVRNLLKSATAKRAEEVVDSHHDSKAKLTETVAKNKALASARLSRRVSKRVDTSAAEKATDMLYIHAVFHLVSGNSGDQGDQIKIKKEEWLTAVTHRRSKEPALHHAFSEFVGHFPQASRLCSPKWVKKILNSTYNSPSKDDNLTEDQIYKFITSNNSSKNVGATVELTTNKMLEDMKFIRTMFLCIDEDNNGLVSKEEFMMAIMSRFMDEKIDKMLGEFVQRFPKGHAEKLLKPGTTESMINSIDSNIDGVLSVKEMHDFVEGRKNDGKSLNFNLLKQTDNIVKETKKKAVADKKTAAGTKKGKKKRRKKKKMKAVANVAAAKNSSPGHAWLENIRLEKYYSPLTELGVESLDDLKDIVEDDLASLGMKKLEMRRLLAAIAELSKDSSQMQLKT